MVTVTFAIQPCHVIDVGWLKNSCNPRVPMKVLATPCLSITLDTETFLCIFQPDDLRKNWETLTTEQLYVIECLWLFPDSANSFSCKMSTRLHMTGRNLERSHISRQPISLLDFPRSKIFEGIQCSCLGWQISFCEWQKRFDHLQLLRTHYILYILLPMLAFVLFVYNGKHMLAFLTLDERVEWRSALMSRNVVSIEKYSQQNQRTSLLLRKLNPHYIPRGFFFLSSSEKIFLLDWPQQFPMITFL